MRRVRIVTLGLALAVVCLPEFAHGLPVLDQTFGEVGPGHEPSGSVDYYTNFNYEQAQTFTVGATGSLTRAGAFLGACCASYYGDPGPMEPLTIQLRRTAGGLPSQDPGDVLAFVEIPKTEIRTPETVDTPYAYNWIEWEFAGAPAVRAGDTLALVFVGYPVDDPFFEFDPTYFVAGDYSAREGQYARPMYDGGSAVFRQTAGGAWQSIDDAFETWDMYFATWVEPQTVPEPGAVAAIALAGLVLVFRRTTR